MKKNFGKFGFGQLLVVVAIAAVAVLLVAKQAGTLITEQSNVEAAGKGFDQYGYNYDARLFQGAADGVDRNLDGTVWGDATYGKDRLVMKWSKAWDAARFGGEAWTADAWEDNEWNGMFPGGSGQVWHYKVIWVGPALQSSQYWRPGGYAIWGEFEVIMDQGVDKTLGALHSWFAHAAPNGYRAR